jgi:hypothetical protein
MEHDWAVNEPTLPSLTGNPRARVDEPLRTALSHLVLESTVAFALAAIAVSCPAIFALEGLPCDLLHLSGPLLLTAWVVASWCVRTFRRRPEIDAATAWEQARRADRTEANIAVAIAAVSTVAVGFAFTVTVQFYFDEPGMRATTITVMLPALIALYLAVIATGIHNTTDRLARAMTESDARFRAYWRGIADHKDAA